MFDIFDLFDLIKKKLDARKTEKKAEELNRKRFGDEKERRILLASIVLLLEIAYSNERFTLNENIVIHDIMRDELGIPEEDIRGILDISEEYRKHFQNLKDYSDTIKRDFTREEKFLLMQRLWKIVYADGHTDINENLLMTELS
ncbi:MAG: hypothetical protein GY757_37815 [bacterium]|nr:hypothetical protein [bacterium]